MKVVSDENGTPRKSSLYDGTTAPDIRTDRLGWFRYYDEDGNGSLDKVKWPDYTGKAEIL